MLSQKQAFVLAVASGKGGVGKTSLATNLGIALAEKGDRACVFDADTGLANINILLRMHPEFTLADVLIGEKSLDEVLMQGPGGMHIVPAASGIEGIVELTGEQKGVLRESLQKLESSYDYLLIDMAAGLGDTAMTLLRMAPNIMLVVTSEPTSLTDAFSVLKVLKRSGAEPSVRVVVNQVSDDRMAERVYKRFASAVKKYLEYDLSFIGKIPQDTAVVEAIRFQKPLLEFSPNSNATRAVRGIADRLRLLRTKSSQPMVFNPVDWQVTGMEGPKARQGKEQNPNILKEKQPVGASLEIRVKEVTEAAAKLQDSIRKIHLKQMEQPMSSNKDAAPIVDSENVLISGTDWQGDLLAGVHLAAMYGEKTV